MMGDIAIRVDQLGKRYRIGEQQRYQRFSEVLASAAMAPFRQLRDLANRDPLKHRHIWALKDVSFDVKKGEVIGLIGRNGAGKSTLLKILSQITEPTEGSAKIYGRVGSLLEVGTGFHPELTGRENIFLNGAILGMSRNEIKKKFDEIVDFAETETFLDTPVKRYSSGMYTRLAFAVAANLESDILLIDEVLAVGDAAFQRKCMGKMGDVAKTGRTVFFVSHNTGAVARLCQNAILIAGGEMEEYGPATEVVAKYHSESTSVTAEIDLKNYKYRSGSGELRFNWARIRNERGELSSQFSVGDDLYLEFEIEVVRPIDRARLAVTLRASDGLALCNMIDVDSGFEFDRPQRKEIIRIRIDDLRLYPDTYSLGFWSGNLSTTGAYDAIDACLSFHIVDGGRLTQRRLPRNAGILFLTPQWSRESERASVWAA